MPRSGREVTRRPGDPGRRRGAGDRRLPDRRQEQPVLAARTATTSSSSSVSGLKPGSPVQLNGVDVGTVEKVILPQDPRRSRSRSGSASTATTPSASAAGRSSGERRAIRRRRRASRPSASWATSSSSSPRARPSIPVIPSGGEIPAAAADQRRRAARLGRGRDGQRGARSPPRSPRILARMERGEGLLGELTSDSESGERQRSSLLSTGGVDGADRRARSRPARARCRAAQRPPAGRPARLVARPLREPARPGPERPRPAARRCSTIRRRKQTFDDTLATLNQVAEDLQAVTADLETSDALLPRLVNDEEYGREVTGEVQRDRRPAERGRRRALDAGRRARRPS